MTHIRLPQHSQHHRRAGDSVMGGEMPIGRIGRTKVHLSYAVFVAAVFVAIVVASVTSRQANSDLPIAACIAAGIWIAGWGVQLLTYLVAIKLRNLQLDSVTVGLFGVETRPHAWTASETLVVSLVTCLSLVVTGCVLVLAGSGTLWRLPAIELSAAGSIWHAAAWLFGFQAVCQLFPLPRTLGRQTLLGLIARLTRQADDVTQVLNARRALVGVAAISAVAAVALFSIESPTFGFPRWVLLSFLAVLLAVSSRWRDVGESIRGFRVASNLDDERLPGPVGIGLRGIRTWRDRRRAKSALQQEHREAVDAARLDEILAQLHRQGADSLSKDDRQLLQRMSESLRRHRESKSESDSSRQS